MGNKLIVKCPYCKSRKGIFKVTINRNDGCLTLECLDCKESNFKYVSNQLIAQDWFQIERKIKEK